MRKRGIAKAVAAALAATMMLTACGGGGDKATTAATATTAADGESAAATTAAGGETGGTITKTDIVFAQKSDIVTLDPQGENDTTTNLLMRHLYSKLVDVDNDGNMIGQLAESWDMPDDQTYHFKLKEGVKFTDGTELKSSDVAFTLERAKTMPRTKSSVEKIAEISTDGDYDVTVKLSQPYAPFLAVLTNGNMSIVSEKAVTAAGEAYGDVDNVVTNGPFKIQEWVPNDHWTIVRDDNFWGEAPIATSITCRIMPEGGARAISLETGEVDLVWSVDATDVGNVEANPDLYCEKQISPSIEYLGMNTQKEVFADKKVREAINYALDKQAFVDTVIEGRGQVANSVMSMMVPGWNNELEPYPYDVEKAKALMAEAGYTDGFECKLYVSGDVRNRSAQLIQAQLAEIGIKVDISMYEWGAFLESLNAGEHDMFILGWSNSTFDPEQSIFPLFHSSNWGSTGNRAFLKDEALDKAIDDASKEIDNEKRMQMYKDIQVTLKDIAPWAPLYYQEVTVGRRADLKGFQLHKGGNHYLGNLHYEE